ncbi:MAG TPA: glycosyltransferase family 4 protein [Anaerolineales bacterium]|nr:glycosyltransferase family 4 protein [Anaerolineales bacterium]
MNTPILFLDHANALGGAEHSLLLILKNLDRTLYQPHLACVSGPLAERAKELGGTVHAFDFPRLRRSPRFLLDWARGANEIARLARGIGARALYANTVRAALYAAPAARLARVPFIWHMRDFWLSESRPRALWADTLGKRMLIGAARRVMTNSHAVAAELPGSAKISVVHNAVEIAQFDPAMDGRVFRAQYGIPGDAPVAGVVGRLRPWKGQDRFVRAMAQVAERLPAARFLIVGGEIFGVQDDFERDLHALVASLGLAERVIFTGQLSDVHPALAAMDVFVHPGEPEPFGLVNIEAMAMGRTVVAFGHGALPEIVVDGETGLLVPPGDEGALAEAVLEVLRDPARARQMGAAGRVRVEAHFTVQQTVAGVERVLGEVLR